MGLFSGSANAWRLSRWGYCDQPCEPGLRLSDMSAVVRMCRPGRTMDPGSVLLAATSERHTSRSQVSRIRQTYKEKGPATPLPMRRPDPGCGERDVAERLAQSSDSAQGRRRLMKRVSRLPRTRNITAVPDSSSSRMRSKSSMDCSGSLLISRIMSICRNPRRKARLP